MTMMEQILKEREECQKEFKRVIKGYESTFNTRARCYNCKTLKIDQWVKMNEGLNINDWIFTCENCGQ